jgi:SAM-dependent methyltransferase
MARDPSNPLTPPSDLICAEEAHFYKGKLWVEYFSQVCGLRPDEHVLDIGSGGGRVAIPLSDYLTDGRYEGFDTRERDVQWCRENITARAPNFKFRHVDILNTTYNPEGTIQSSEFEFPYEDSQFDFVFLTSIFTHMLPADVEHYFAEIARVLKPDGRWLATWFILDDESLGLIRDGKSFYDFAHDRGPYRVVDPERPEDAVAFPEAYVLGLYDRFGFDAAVDLGQWAGRPATPTNRDGQDIIVARPRERS